MKRSWGVMMIRGDVSESLLDDIEISCVAEGIRGKENFDFWVWKGVNWSEFVVSIL